MNHGCNRGSCGSCLVLLSICAGLGRWPEFIGEVAIINWLLVCVSDRKEVKKKKDELGYEIGSDSETSNQ